MSDYISPITTKGSESGTCSLRPRIHVPLGTGQALCAALFVFVFVIGKFCMTALVLVFVDACYCNVCHIITLVIAFVRLIFGESHKKEHLRGVESESNSNAITTTVSLYQHF